MTDGWPGPGNSPSGPTLAQRSREQRARRCRRLRRVCRNITLTVIWTIGLTLTVAFVGHVIWLRFGWEDVPLRCYENAEWGGWQELTGTLQPQAADTLYAVLAELYGEDAVKRDGAGRVKVRPAVSFFDDGGRLRDVTTVLTYRFAIDRGNVPRFAAWVSDCRLTQYELFANGRARSCWDPWEPHVIGVIAQDSWPWLTRAFQVHVPEPNLVEDVSAPTAQVPADSRPRLANLAIPDDIACGFAFDDRIWFYKTVAVGLLVSPLSLFW